MIITLRHSSSVRSLSKLKKGKSFSWSTKSRKQRAITPEVDFAAFRSGLASDDHDLRPRQRTISIRRPRATSRHVKRDTIFLDLSNNDLIPALDYAFAILDDDQVSIHSLPPPSPPPPPKMPALTRGPSTDSTDILYTPSTSTFSPISLTTPSVRSSPPQYTYASSPLSTAPTSPIPCTRLPSTRPTHRPAASFDPAELSLALTHAQAFSSLDLPSPVFEHAIPFPPPAAPPATRVPLLLRKPRLHSAESSIDGHEQFAYRSYPCSSKASLARSVSSLGHHHDVFGARSTTSLHTPDSTLSALLAQQPRSRGPYGSLRLFSKKSRQSPRRRASTPPPSRARPDITPAQCPPVPALPDLFTLGPAARREASSSSLRSHAVRANLPCSP